jgi:choline dehydrogenase-like flavoprotein
MQPDVDVTIVGSGPAGVSAAFPLVQAGFKVLMVDGGRKASLETSSNRFLTERFNNTAQWKWMIGSDFSAIQKFDAVSPKLRVPIYDYVFDDFLAVNHIEAKDFIAVGSLARGGLSNAWGCGVARLSAHELASFPFTESEIIHSYELVTRRIGVSGANEDDLSDYFGLDTWSQPPIAMDRLHDHLLKKYRLSQFSLNHLGFRLGRSRVAVLSQEDGERKACDTSGSCLWGCHRNALYSATVDIAKLMKYENFYYRSGFIIEEIGHYQGILSVQGTDFDNTRRVTSKRIMLATGTLATTRLALKALNYYDVRCLQSSPTAAFLLWLPRMLSNPRVESFGLGQLSYSLQLNNEVSAFGSTFSTLGIPMTEFVRYLPLGRRYGIDLLKYLLSSCLVGNVFLPGNLSNSTVQLGGDGILRITGGYHDAVQGLMSEVVRRLRKVYWKCGAWLLPMSFTIGKPGADIHYASTLPMRVKPRLGETDKQGELFGLPGVYIIDGASLSTLSEKSHTLTIMANADRIARALANQLQEK